MERASITEPWFVNANRANYKIYNTISILQSCGKPFITETKGSNSGNTTHIWQWCPQPELSADSEEISFALGTTKYSKVKITLGICMPEMSWLISKISLTWPECFLETSECRRGESPPKGCPCTLARSWSQAGAHEWWARWPGQSHEVPLVRAREEVQKNPKSFFLCLRKKALRHLMNGCIQQHHGGPCSPGQGERAGWEGERRVRRAEAERDGSRIKRTGICLARERVMGGLKTKEQEI